MTPSRAEILSQCDGHLKRALVVALTGVDPDMAQTLLDAQGGQVRGAVKAGRRERATMMLSTTRYTDTFARNRRWWYDYGGVAC